MPPRTEWFGAIRKESLVDSQSSIGALLRANNANELSQATKSKVVRKNVSGVRNGRLTDHRQASVYDNDSAIRAAIAAKREPIGERGRD